MAATDDAFLKEFFKSDLKTNDTDGHAGSQTSKRKSGQFSNNRKGFAVVPEHCHCFSAYLSFDPVWVAQSLGCNPLQFSKKQNKLLNYFIFEIAIFPRDFHPAAVSRPRQTPALPLSESLPSLERTKTGLGEIHQTFAHVSVFCFRAESVCEAAAAQYKPRFKLLRFN